VIRLDRIVPDPGQPRTEFDPDALARLADSLKQRGQLQPIRVRWDDALDRYVVVVGERRYRAAGLAGMETIACVVTTGSASSEDLLEDQLVENALREDLRPIEQARAYRSLLTARGLTRRELADRLQIGHASITRALALLELPETIQADVESGKIAPNTAYELSKVDDPAEQATLARDAAGGRLRRDELKGRNEAARSRGRGAKRPPKPRVIRTPAGRVTVEPKAAGVEAILAALRDATRVIEAELSAGDQTAA
jgi:ParB family chromosome partitioning protein